MMAAVREMTSRDVLVVGAGPAGLVAACELARHNVAVRLVERRAAPDPQSRAVGLHAGTQDLLGTLGVIGRLSALGRQVSTVRARDLAGHAEARIDLSDLPTRYRYMLDVTQASTEAVLRERAAECGVRVEWGVELADLRQDGSGVDTTLSSAGGDETARFGFVIGADGSSSTVRDLVGARLDGNSPSEHFIVADVSTSPGPRADMAGDRELTLMVTPDGVAGAFPLAPDQVRLMFAVRDPARPPTAEDVETLCAQRFGGRFRAGTPNWVATFEGRDAQVSSYRFNRVFLVGDAAHVHGPAGGTGMNIGMQDAFNLAWKMALVARGRAHGSLLDSYHAERHPVAARGIANSQRLADLVGAAAQSPRTPLGNESLRAPLGNESLRAPLGNESLRDGALQGEAVRRLALAAIGQVGPDGQVWAEHLADLAVSYHDSPAVGHHGAMPRGTGPGRHAPVPMDLPDGPGHTILLRSQDTAMPAALQDVLDGLGTVVSMMDTTGKSSPPQDALAARYDIAADGFVAIRPDGYIGYLAAPASTSALRTYLHDHLRAI